MEFIGIGLIAFGLLWAAAFGFAHFRAVAKARASGSWPSTFGRVVSSEVRVEESSDSDGRTTTWYNPVVTYTYTAAGKARQSSRIRFGNYRSGSRGKAEAMVAPYPAGSSPAVRYNPDNPDECVLETRGPSPLYLVMAIFGLIFVGFGLFWNSLG